ncbi:hypothetical protein ABIE49_005685 [Bradyrhizobium sp. OAE829]
MRDVARTAGARLTLGGRWSRNRSSPAAFAFMTETLMTTIEDSFQIAWDYLEATGELGHPDTAANHLLDTIETMVRRGERRRLLLSNTAIASYQRFRTEQGLSLAS